MTDSVAGSGAVAGLLTGIQVGAALFASQLVVGDVGVGLLGLLRYGIALLFLLPLLLLKPSTPVARADWLPIILLGLGQIGVMIALLNTAVAFTSAARVALIFATLPAVSLLIDVAKGRLFGGWRTGLGVALSIGGVTVLVGGDAINGGIRAGDVIGMVAAAGATLGVAVCSSFYAPFVKRYGAIKVSTVAFTASMLPLGLIAIILPSAVTPDQWSGMIWWLVLAIGLSSGVGYLMWFHAIEKLPATLVTGFLALSPITAAVLSLIFLEAAVTSSLLIATALVCSGIVCFARFKSPSTERNVRPL